MDRQHQCVQSDKLKTEKKGMENYYCALNNFFVSRLLNVLPQLVNLVYPGHMFYDRKPWETFTQVVVYTCTSASISAL